MPLPLATVGGKITAAFINAIVAMVNRQGSTACIPVTVSGTGTSILLSSAGRVTFTAASLVNVNGVFSTAFDHYRMVLRCEATASMTFDWRFRSAGVDYAGATYSHQWLVGAGATASAAASSGVTVGNFIGGLGGAATFVIAADVFSPMVADETFMQSRVSARPNAGGTKYVQLIDEDVNVLNLFDGISLIPSAGTISGTLDFYGYNKNA